MDWYIEQAGKIAGPFSTGVAVDQLKGANGPETLVWRDGLEGWQTAREQPEFATLLSKRPPPLPSRDVDRIVASDDEPFELAPAVRSIPGSARSRWSVKKAATWGALSGMMFAAIRTSIELPGAPVEYYAGGLVGGAVVCALLFSVVATVRNAAACP